MTMPSRHQSGFTLLEVVVAFVVLALALSTVFQIFSAGLARTGHFEEQSQALSIAQSALALAGAEEGIKEGETRGESADRRYRWTVRSARHDEPPAPGADRSPRPQSTFSLYRVEVDVAWSGADGRAHDLRLAKLLIGHKASP
jgi:general secretion pathway protein I